MKPENSDRDVDAAIMTVLATHPSIRLAILFGSFSAGRASCVSDIDLAVGADQPLAAEEKLRLIMSLAEKFGRPVDLVDLCTVGEPLLGQILAGGRRITGDDGRYAVMVNRHLVNQADFVPYQRRILAERRQAWIGS